jgi:tripartite-type tricarboxylate transporter receptor subunit TctC
MRRAPSPLRATSTVASINNDSFVLLANPSFAAKTVPEFIAYTKANPGKINLASNGTGNLAHLSGELFRMMTGIEVIHVPYRGTPAAHSALLAGDVHAMFDAIGSALPQIQAGALRALGVTAPARLRVLPDIPPIGDVVPAFAVTGWLGIGVPKGTPAEIVERLNREVNAALADPAVKARMADLGSEPPPARSPTSPSSSPRKLRSGLRWSNSPASRRSRPIICDAVAESGRTPACGWLTGCKIVPSAS